MSKRTENYINKYILVNMSKRTENYMSTLYIIENNPYEILYYLVRTLVYSDVYTSVNKGYYRK